MVDSRITKLARLLMEYSTELKKDEKVLIEVIDVPDAMTTELIRAARAVGAQPFVTIKHNEVLRTLLMEASEVQMQLMGDAELHFMKEMDAYIGVRGSLNISELSDVRDEKMKLYQRVWWKPLTEHRVRHTKWVVLRFPSPSMAQSANMSTEAFEDFYYDVCTMDYAKMAKAMQPLRDLMAKTDRVRIVGPGTELTFSIKGIPAIACDGKLNIPDGEVFTAPVRDSVHGTVQFNTPTIYHGITHENVRLTFKEGKVVEASSTNTAALNAVLDSDEGARYVGEFAIGFNPYITRAMKDILFDEKIAGSFHFTPGAAYEDEADNGNRSQIHWDMVCLQDSKAGGGEIHFDEKLIRKDGLFVLDELKGLNPDNLK